jgi:hypothetical protein
MTGGVTAQAGSQLAVTLRITASGADTMERRAARCLEGLLSFLQVLCKLAHVAGSDRRDDFVRPETIANSKGHGGPEDLSTLIVMGRDLP